MRPIIVASVIAIFALPCVATPARAEGRGGAGRAGHVSRGVARGPVAVPRAVVAPRTVVAPRAVVAQRAFVAPRAVVVPRTVVVPRAVVARRVVAFAPVRFVRPYY